MTSAPPSAAQSPSASNSRKWWVLACIGIGQTMAGLDSSIVNALLPTMGNALHANVARIEWVLTIYMLVNSGTLLGVGRLGDLRGHKQTYIGGLAGFVLTSALCGMAPTANWLIAFRAFQALSAAMLFANSPAIITNAFPAGERGRALGLQATMTSIGLSAGPPLGGLLAVHFGWRAVFYINVPVGVLGILLSQRVIPHDRPAGKTAPFDRPGAALFFMGMFSLLLALNQGYAWGWLAPLTLTLALGGLAVLSVFVVVERRRAHPMLDLTLFRQPVIIGSAFSAMLTFVAMNSVMFVLPFYLAEARGLSPEKAGFILMAMPLPIILSAPIAGALSDRLGSLRPTVFGLVILITGLLLLSRAAAATPMWYITAALAVCGTGVGTFVSPNNNRLLTASPVNRRGIASGILAAARNTGMVLGVGISGAVYTTVLAHSGKGGVAHGMSLALRVIAVLTMMAIITSWREGEVATRSTAAHA